MIHVAGEVVRSRGLIRQRCAWCGEALIDTTEVSLQVNPPSVPSGALVPPTWPLWPAGDLVRVIAPDEAEWLPEDDSPGLPDESCLLTN